jgi:hypothetical protein
METACAASHRDVRHEQRLWGEPEIARVAGVIGVVLAPAMFVLPVQAEDGTSLSRSSVPG